MQEHHTQRHSATQLEQFAPNDHPLTATHCETSTVFVINGDVPERQALETAIRSAGWTVKGFASAAAFLSCARELAPSCLVLDPILPDCCGLDLHDRLKRAEPGISIIFITGRPDVSAAVRAMKAGAVEVLARPVDDGVLIGAIDEAIERSRAALEVHSSLSALRRDHACLSKREREVMTLIVSGLLNKQVAYQLGISEITVKAHRGQAMRKMRASSFADLVNKAGRLARATHQYADDPVRQRGLSERIPNTIVQ